MEYKSCRINQTLQAVLMRVCGWHLCMRSMQESGWCCSADDSEGSDGSGGDALGLGYGSDDGSGSDGEDGARIEASSPPDQGAVLEVLAPEQRQDSPGLAERQPVDVNEEQTEHKQDDSRAPEVAEAQSLAGSSVMQSGAGASSEAGLLKTDNAVEHGSAQAHAADYAKADGMDGAAEGQVAAPQGNPASLTNGSAPVQALFSKGSRYWQAVKSAPRLHCIGAGCWLLTVHAASSHLWT